ncbi:DEAD/DEAH box helicase family protein [Vibrio parahaemolyticus]|uniref:DEAD/DEAH box helicase n=1 Tax=Vibrio harveyi group TaxID=717610 RepID=UPI0004D935E3|nr:DEAD/DEAH box helicase family protein [Vibrio parahaemolyticus]EIJ2378986.1 DEAD/DEAH box helicase family protein [Vibrio alginolyticus]EGQ9863000.1 diguanylate cyclase [Vibrio parahaemolyticus]EGR2252614.1 diguanylate cyclase [Vibrio parahaemolyticus]EJG1623720.1 DEAD/DEAH box helicase family protein [Vibrio parahaemolyticus]EJG1689480.1 DEAD/DEAH box helicase family protein [Vibrio parahaemolyticus]
MLRKWQSECSDKALEKYAMNHTHFFCQASPGAGKTVLAANIASRLLQNDMVDLILCFSPSLTVSDGIKKTFSSILGCTFNGGMGSIGQSLTYQSIQFLNVEFWQTLRSHRVFVVFDEIHHCSGSEIENANIWGQQVLTKIQGLATFTLALSGTPWRSDSLPIVLGEYSDPDGQLLVDYQYTLKQAIDDGVCRAPKIVLIDNEHLSVSSSEKIESFSSILEMLKQTKVSYQSVIYNQEAMEYLLGLGCERLAQIRLDAPSAGGLVVAASVQHAQAIKEILSQKFGQTVSIVTYRHEEPLAEIERYRQSDAQWIVSVGMISEGTDIPRLQVCCHMSSVKTELYFRQVLGRILRINSSTPQQAWLFTFAEQSLIQFAERIEDDIPESCLYAHMGKPIESELSYQRNHLNDERSLLESQSTQSANVSWGSGTGGISNQYAALAAFDELLLGAFKQRVISAFSSM